MLHAVVKKLPSPIPSLQFVNLCQPYMVYILDTRAHSDKNNRELGSNKTRCARLLVSWICFANFTFEGERMVLKDLPEEVDAILLEQSQIQARVSDIAVQINEDYAHSDDLLIVGVLKGAFMFMSDLTRQITVPHSVDFVALSSYATGTDSGGVVRMIMDTRLPMTNRDVIIVEDILDTGYTLDYLIRTFKAREPRSVRTCVLLHKPERTKIENDIDYLGFTIPDAWVVGYGLDYNDKCRTLPYIGILKPEVYQ